MGGSLRMSLRTDQIRSLRLRTGLCNNWASLWMLLRSLGSVHWSNHSRVLGQPRIRNSSCRRLRSRGVKWRRQWTIRRNCLRAALIDAEKLRSVLTRLTRMHCLRIERRHVSFPRCLQFCCGGPRRNTTMATVIADAVVVVVVDRHIVNRDVVHVDVLHDCRVYVRDRPVVVEVVVVPVSTVVTPAHVTVTVIDTAVVADVRPPVATVPPIVAMHPTPITRSP